MLQYSNEQLATIVGVPIVTILLVWTVAIFHKNRKRWNSYDIAIVAVLVQSILRNVAILAYTALLIAKHNGLSLDYCRAVVWVFNSVHTFQASSLTTLAVIALFTVKLITKQQSLQQYLTATHVIYHLFCLTTLCACVGVAAILAQEDADTRVRFGLLEPTCRFMPFELDVKFNIFIIVLHIFLAMVSFTAFILICAAYMQVKRQGFDYLKKSTSDLSELSLSLNQNEAKGYYDTYTVEGYEHQAQHHYQHGFCARDPAWNSDLSNISMTVSSTNSKRPCLNKAQQEDQEMESGLHTMYPILAVCYLVNHLPLIVLCIFPRLVSPWPVTGVALWMGQLQDVLIPVGLGLVDSRFCKWVSKVYRCSDRHKAVDKVPPGVGLDGKFRPFGSQPQSLEIGQAHQAHQNHQNHHQSHQNHQAHMERPRGYSPNEPKFPITNGSLYTSIDGRLPIIHNYRRNKDPRGCLKTVAPHSLHVNLHSTHLKRQDYVRPRVDYFSQTSQPVQRDNFQKPPCTKCENLHFSRNINFAPCRRNPSFNHPFERQQRMQKRISLSQDSLCRLPTHVEAPHRPRKKLARLSRSEDCLNDLQKDLQRFKRNPEVFQKEPRGKLGGSRQDLSCISSDDEYFTDSVNLNDTGVDCDATSQSSYSITTEANCDFDFFQSADIVTEDAFPPEEQRKELTTFKPLQTEKPRELVRNLRITRSNSKRSLENFQAYVDEEVKPQVVKIQRSSSFMTVEDRKRFPRVVEQNWNQNITYLEDVYNHNVQKKPKASYHGGSVPDFKKVFISEYI